MRCFRARLSAFRGAPPLDDRAQRRGPGGEAGCDWIVFLYYFTNFILQPVTLGVFLSDLLTTLGGHPGVLTYVAGRAGSVARGPAWIAYRGITPSTQGALGFLLFEAVVVVALSVTVFRWSAPHHGAHFSAEGFHGRASVDGRSGLSPGHGFRAARVLRLRRDQRR